MGTLEALSVQLYLAQLVIKSAVKKNPNNQYMKIPQNTRNSNAITTVKIQYFTARFQSMAQAIYTSDCEWRLTLGIKQRIKFG